MLSLTKIIKNYLFEKKWKFVTKVTIDLLSIVILIVFGWIVNDPWLASKLQDQSFGIEWSERNNFLLLLFGESILLLRSVTFNLMLLILVLSVLIREINETAWLLKSVIFNLMLLMLVLWVLVNELSWLLKSTILWLSKLIWFY